MEKFKQQYRILFFVTIANYLAFKVSYLTALSNIDDESFTLLEQWHIATMTGIFAFMLFSIFVVFKLNRDRQLK